MRRIGQASRQDRALELEQQRRGQRGRAHEHLLAGLDVEAVADEQVGERGGVRGDAISGKGGHARSAQRRRRAVRGSARRTCARSASRTERALLPGRRAQPRQQRAPGPRCSRRRSSSGPRGARRGTRPRAARRPRARPRRSSGRPRSSAAYSCRVPGDITVRSTSSRLAVDVDGGRLERVGRRRARGRAPGRRTSPPAPRRGLPAAAALAVALAHASAPPSRSGQSRPRSRARPRRRRSAARRGPARRRPARASASLRIEARACSVSWLNAASGTRGGP